MFQQQQGKKARQVQNSPTTIEPRSIFVLYYWLVEQTGKIEGPVGCRVVLGGIGSSLLDAGWINSSIFSALFKGIYWVVANLLIGSNFQIFGTIKTALIRKVARLIWYKQLSLISGPWIFNNVIRNLVRVLILLPWLLQKILIAEFSQKRNRDLPILVSKIVIV